MPVNQDTIVLRTAVEYGGPSEYNFANQQYTSKSDTRFLVAMCASRDPTILQG